MLTFIAFAIVMAGCINWLMIGLLQYDFVAGIFGYQGSVFSRLVYIVVGAASIFLLVKLFIDKGSIHVWGKKKKEREEYKKQLKQEKLAHSNIEAAREERRHSDYTDKKEDEYFEHKDYYSGDYRQSRENSHPQQSSLFDEHFDDRERK